MIEFAPVKDFCLEELRIEEDERTLSSIYVILLKAKGKSYTQARTEFMKFRRQQLSFNFPKNNE